MSANLQVVVEVVCDNCDAEFNSEWCDYDDDHYEVANELVEYAGGATNVEVDGYNFDMLCEGCWCEVYTACSFCDDAEYTWNENLHWCFDSHWNDDHEECAIEAHRQWWADGDLTLDAHFECEECETPVTPTLVINAKRTHKPIIRLKASV